MVRYVFLLTLRFLTRTSLLIVDPCPSLRTLRPLFAASLHVLLSVMARGRILFTHLELSTNQIGLSDHGWE